MAKPVTDHEGRIAPGKREPVVCNLAGDVVLELALEIHTDEEHGLIVVRDSLSGVRVVFGPDAMIDVCQRGLAACMQLRSQHS
jgi:hypothetical protein